MKFLPIAVTASLMVATTTTAFTTSTSSLMNVNRGTSSLNMVLEKPATKKKISKLETLKIDSDNLRHPLKEVCI